MPVVLAACASTYPLMATPDLYRSGDPVLFANVPAAQKTSSIDILYMTDRAPRTNPEDPEPYTADRAHSMAFGTVRVNIGQGVGWDSLASQSSTGNYTSALDLSLGPAHELGRFPAIVYDLVRTRNGVMRDPKVMDAHEKADADFKAELARRVAESPRKEVVLFVHGYHVPFSDAAFTTAELCHFLGREFPCVLFTWPAGGKRGVLFGYNVDTESGEFAAEHLKKTIRLIADTPGVERLHLIAHSRGTAILVSALAALHVETYITRTTLTERLKIHDVILAAPDLDFDVAAAKMFTVVSDPDLPFGSAPNPRGVFPLPEIHLTIYVSPQDKAIAASSFLEGSLMRIGRINVTDMPKEIVDRATRLGLFDVITFTGSSDMFGHSYFHENPEVSSDIVALIRYGAKPGDKLRPLTRITGPFWRIEPPSSSK